MQHGLRFCPCSRQAVVPRVTVEQLGSRCRALFAVLAEAGFHLAVDLFRPEVFGDFIVLCSLPDATWRVISDRGQVVIEVALPDGGWRDKEEILEAAGIPRSRHGMVAGLWTGHEPDVQAEDVRRYLAVLLPPANDGAA